MSLNDMREKSKECQQYLEDHLPEQIEFVIVDVNDIDEELCETRMVPSLFRDYEVEFRYKGSFQDSDEKEDEKEFHIIEMYSKTIHLKKSVEIALQSGALYPVEHVGDMERNFFIHIRIKENIDESNPEEDSITIEFVLPGRDESSYPRFTP